MNAILVQTPNIDFDRLLTAMYQITDKPLIEDSGLRSSPCEKWGQCLRALGVKGAALMEHSVYSVLLVDLADNVVDILQVLGGRAAVCETKIRHARAMLLTATLRQWREAFLTACHPDQPTHVRAAFGQIVILFETAGVPCCEDLDKTKRNDGTLTIYDPKH